MKVSMVTRCFDRAAMAGRGDGRKEKWGNTGVSTSLCSSFLALSVCFVRG